MPHNQPFEHVDIRLATPADVPFIYGLVKELAAYEKAPQEVTATLEMYNQDFKDGIYQALVIEYAHKVIGTAIYYMTYSTWKGRMVYLEDFIITESFRRQGFGKALFDAFLQQSKKEGAKLVKWQVLSWNTPAIMFYKKHYPSRFDNEWINGKIIFE